MSLLANSLAKVAQAAAGEQVINLPLDRIDPDPNQPRKTFDPDAMEEITASIAAKGVLQPIVVVMRGSRYLIVFGERRWRGSRMAGKQTVPVIVRQYSEVEIQAVRLLENRAREAVAAIEEAAAYKIFIDTLGNVRGVQKQAAEMLGISEATLSQRLSLLTMPAAVKDAYTSGHISDATTALDVSRIHATDPAAAGALVEKAKGGDLKRAEVRETVKATKEKAGKKEKTPPEAAAPETPRCDKTLDMWASAQGSNDSAEDSPASLSVCQNSLSEQQSAALSDLLDELAERPDPLKSFARVIRTTLARAEALGLNHWTLSAAINGGTKTEESGNGR